MVIYVCQLCGYEYDPKSGDPENGIPEKTEFEDLPEQFVCPLCGAAKEDFEKARSEDDE
jgi:rubredoxin